MVIEVSKNVIIELITRTSNLRKLDIALGKKLTTGGYRHWIHPGKTKNDGKHKFVEAWDRSNIAETGLGLARNQTDSHQICTGKGKVLAVQ